MCSLIYKEMITQYINNGSDVYSCLLDTSKAFDRVHYGKLFRILSSYLFILLNSYTKYTGTQIFTSIQ